MNFTRHCFFFVFLIYNRISSAILRQATYGTIKFGTYYSLKRVATDRWGTDDLVLINVVCAAVAGAISSAIANPTDVVKVRMQVTGVEGNLSLIGCFRDVYQHEGVRGLWRVKHYIFQKPAESIQYYYTANAKCSLRWDNKFIYIIYIRF